MAESATVAQPPARWPWQRSLQTRIVLTYGSVFALALVLLMLVIGRFVYAAQLANAERTMEVEAFLAANALQDPLSGFTAEFEAFAREDHERRPLPTGFPAQRTGEVDDEEHDAPPRATAVPVAAPAEVTGRLQQAAAQVAADTGARMTILDSLGNPVADSTYATLDISNQLDQPEVQAALRSEAQPDVRIDSLAGVATLFVATPIQQGDRVLGLVQLSRPMDAVTASAWSLLLRLVVAGLAVLLVVMALAVGLARRLVHPVRAMEQAALAVAAGDLSRQVPVATADELGALARAFNDMVNSLRRLLEQQRLFVANASHELRTPLTNIKLRSEALLDAPADTAVNRRYLVEIDREADRLARLAAVLLDLSSLSQSGSQPAPEPVDIMPVLREVIDVMRLRTIQAGLALTLDAPQTLPWLRVVPQQLEAILLNLLDNAVKYTPAPGTITLTAQTGAGLCRLRVRDSGTGIAPEELPFIFERFYRVDKARTRSAAGRGVGSGAGLGLSIVHALVEQNGGTIRVESIVGRGTVFEIEFPLGENA
jgi:signal transduction histidine kinase